MEELKTAKQIVAETNELAREFYSMLGYNRPKSFLFYKATHPQGSSKILERNWRPGSGD
jgi:hypothetical protein